MDTRRPLAPGQIVPARSDLLFRRIFGDAANADLLGSLLSSVLPDLPVAEWEQVRLPDTHDLPDSFDGKTTILDVRAVTSTGIAVDVEVQLCPGPALPERLAVYESRLLGGQLRRGDPYTRVRPAVTVVICGFELFGSSRYHRRFRILDTWDHLELTDVFELHTVELPKVPAVDDGSDLWDWMRFVAADTEEELDMAAKDNPQIARAATLVKHFSADESLRAAVESRDRFLWDQATREDHARTQGLEQGLEQGREEGREEGRDRLRETAHNALRLGMTVEQVATITGLDLTEVATLSTSD